MFEKILFPVRKEKFLYNNKETGKSLIIREDTNDLISVVSDDYLLIPNRLVVDNLLKEFSGIIEMNTARIKQNTFSNINYSSLSFDLKYPKREVKTGDVVGAVLRVENSYDTTKALRVSMNALRLVCSNGMTVDSEIFHSKTKHIGDAKAEEVVLEMITKVKDKGEEKFLGLGERFLEMANTELTPDIKEEFIKIISSHPKYVVEAITNQIISTKPKDLWDLYNCVTYVATHDMDRSRYSTLKTEEELNKSVISLMN